MIRSKPCPYCDDGHLVAPTLYFATATYAGISLIVSGEERVCAKTGEVFYNTQDRDVFADAREKLNAALGQPADTRLSFVHYERIEKPL